MRTYRRNARVKPAGCREGRIERIVNRLWKGGSEATLRSAINGLARDNVVNIVLNLAEVTKIDGDGPEALVFCYRQIRKCGSALKLARLNIEHLSLDVLTKLSTVFEVFADERNGVNSFFPRPATRHRDISEWVREQEITG